MAGKKKVGVLGGGFAGLFTVFHLARLLENEIEITLFDRNNYFLYTPMLHEVATGSVNARHVVVPIRKIVDPTRVHVRCEEVIAVDLQDRTLQTASNRFVFDFLVLAQGSTANFYDIPGVREHSITFKTIADVIRLRNAIIAVLERAAIERDREKRIRLLSINVAGAGCTGCEVVTEIAQFLHIILGRDYPEIKLSEIRINLIEAAGKVLPTFPAYLSCVALERMRGMGIEVHLNAPITRVDQECIELKDGTKIPNGILVWAAGIKAVDLIVKPEVQRDAGGRIVVDAHLEIPGHPGLFAIGDGARVDQSGTALSSTASVAVQEAKYVAECIRDDIREQETQPFRFRYRGDMASLGFMSGVSEVYGIKIKAFPAWMIWKVFKLAMLPRYKNRFQILADWIITWIFKRDTSRFM